MAMVGSMPHLERREEMPGADEGLYLRANEVAAAINVKNQTICTWAKRGKVNGFLELDSNRHGWRLEIASVRAYLASLPRDNGHSLRKLDRWLESRPVTVTSARKGTERSDRRQRAR